MSDDASADGSVDEDSPAKESLAPVTEGSGMRMRNEVRVRAGLVYLLALGYLAMIAVGLVMAFQSTQPFGDYYRLLDTALPTLTGFVGTAIGFYFGDHGRRDQ